MTTISFKKEEVIDDYNVNIRLATFIVIVVVILLTLIYFVRIYTNKQIHVLSEMKTEAHVLQSVIEDHLNYARYFINTISRNIQPHYNDLGYIRNILRYHYHLQDFNLLFGWRKFSWVDKNFNELVTSTSGIIPKPRRLTFIEDIIKDINFNNSPTQGNIIFYTKKVTDKADSLKLIDSLVDGKTSAYIGSVILSYDLETMIRSLNDRKQNRSTNFVIVDENLNVVAQSSPTIDKIINPNAELSEQLKNILNEIDFTKPGTNDFSYLGMIDGVNFYIKPIKESLPFIIIVNIDNNIIKHNILDSVTKKFIEVSIFAIICLVMVIAVYKRETALRAKAEFATKEANKATKAKTDFLAFTAHEIRSPLGFIQTGSEMMTKQLLGPLSDAYMKYALGIYQNAHLILDFITDILDENQIIEGKFKIINSPADIKNIIKEALRISRARYKQREVKIKAIYQDEVLPKLICDKRRILQVLSNLISNGIKYSNDGTKLTVLTLIEDEKLEIHVIDQGMGMSKEDIKIALSTYGTVNKSNYHSSGSYGLGLPIVKMLLDAHDAVLRIESQENVGTTVKIIFPKEKLVYNEE